MRWNSANAWENWASNVLLALGAARLQKLLQLLASALHRRGGRTGLVGESLRVLVGRGHDGALLRLGGRSQVQAHPTHQFDSLGLEGELRRGIPILVEMQHHQ